MMEYRELEIKGLWTYKNDIDKTFKDRDIYEERIK